MPTKTSELRPWDHFERRQLSSLSELFVVATLMFDGRDSSDILRLAADVVPSLGPFAVEAIFDGTDGGLHRSSPSTSPDLGLDARVQCLGGADSEIASPEGGWRWALFTKATGTLVTGCLVVRSTAAPTSDELFLLKALAQPTGAALANAGLIRRERKLLVELRRSAAERAEAIDKPPPNDLDDEGLRPDWRDAEFGGPFPDTMELKVLVTTVRNRVQRVRDIITAPRPTRTPKKNDHGKPSDSDTAGPDATDTPTQRRRVDPDEPPF